LEPFKVYYTLYLGLAEVISIHLLLLHNTIAFMKAIQLMTSYRNTPKPDSVFS